MAKNGNKRIARVRFSAAAPLNKSYLSCRLWAQRYRPSVSDIIEDFPPDYVESGYLVLKQKGGAEMGIVLSFVEYNLGLLVSGRQLGIEERKRANF